MIVIKGARQNNLKNIDIEIPRDQLVVITGLSGSGKSSLALTPYMLGTETIRGVPLSICQTVFGTDGQA